MYISEDSYHMSKPFSIINAFIDDTHTVFKDYLNESYNIVKEKQDKLDSQLAILESKDPIDESQIFYQHDYEPERLKYYDLKNTFLYAGVSFIYSQFDIYFKDIANASQVLFKSKKSLDNYKHEYKKYNRDIYKSKHYIIDTFKIDLHYLDDKWYKIENFKKLRNYYVHQNGNMLNDPKFLKYIEIEKGISLTAGQIEISKEYLLDIVDVLFAYLKEIMKKLYSKANNHEN